MPSPDPPPRASPPDPRPGDPPDPSTPARFGATWLLAPYRWPLVGTALLSLVGGLCEAAVLVLIVNAAVLLSSRAAAAGSFSIGPLRASHVGLGLILTLAFAATCLRLVAQLGASSLTSRLVAQVQFQLRVAIVDAFINATWAVQSAEREGSLQQVLTLEVQRSSDAAIGFATSLGSGCSLSALLVTAVVLSPLGALAMVTSGVALFFALRPVTRWARRMATARSGEELGAARSIAELVRTAEEIRVHGAGTQEKGRLRRETERIARWVRRINFVGLAVAQVYQASALLLLLVALFVVYQLPAGNVANLGAVVLVLLRSFAYTQQLQASYHNVVSNAASIERVQAVQTHYSAQAACFGRRPLKQIESLALESVVYCYRPPDRALNGVSFDAGAGEVLGVVGPSGAGKSTLVQILLRLRAPMEGRYLVNGADAEEFAPSDWSQVVSYVPQDPKLLSATVAENIRFLRPGFSDADVERAARQAHLHTEIMSWPDGYSTQIGPRADGISGGQRQRLCIARALLSSPGLLILDEPTSALDALSEQAIRRSLEDLRGRSTIVIVAHRLSTLQLCDRLVVLRDGRLEALGPAGSLASQGGFYRDVLASLTDGSGL